MAACTKEVSMDLPDTGGVPSVSCFFTPDSLFRVFIGESSGILDDSAYTVQNASVTIFENGVFYDSLHHETGGWYASAKKPQTGLLYELKVAISGKAECTAADIIPQKIMILSTQYKDSALYDVDGYNSEVSISFADMINHKNYYELLLNRAYYDDEGQLICEHLSCPGEKITDNVLKNEGLLDYSPGTFVFSDELIDGATHEIKLYFKKPDIAGNSKIVAVLRSVSESYYNYRKKLILHLNNQQSNLWNGAGNPVSMYSNITNGYGIFAAYCIDTDTIEMP